MNHPSIQERLAVCSWSLQPASPEQLIEYLTKIGLPRVQIALDPIREHPESWGRFPAMCEAKGIQMISGMMVTVGEDYSTMDSIRRTGGIVPDATWEANWKNFRANAVLASELNMSLVTFHAGFLPEDETCPEFAKLRDRLEKVGDAFAEEGIDLGLETGQESAETLGEFLGNLNRPNVGVNFDPANMILYDKGNPIDSLRLLAPWLKQCHIKDATKTKEPGTWGAEVTVGEGEVDWPGFFATLDEVGYEGFHVIEREAGEQRLKDIVTARTFVEALD